jgi:hypothetical protein
MTTRTIVAGFVALTICVALATKVLADYSIVTSGIDAPPPPNVCKIVSMTMDFERSVQATVVLRLSAVTNMPVQQYVTFILAESVTTTNEANEITVTTNLVSESVLTNIMTETTMYTYPHTAVRMTAQESLQMAGLTVEQFGLTATNTVAQVIDALIRAGMQEKGFTVTGGKLSDVPY